MEDKDELNVSKAGGGSWFGLVCEVVNYSGFVRGFAIVHVTVDESRDSSIAKV